MNLLCNILNKRACAVANVRGSEKYSDIRGKVSFYNVNDGVLVRAEITGLPINNRKCQSPIFAFHIHSGSECSGTAEDPFSNAGMHYNPDDCEHPYHAGDMPPLLGAKGKSFMIFLTDRFTINEIIGRTVIIHAKPDDFATQPSGNSGEKIACGTIMKT